MATDSNEDSMPNQMSFDAYQAFTRETAIYPGAGTGSAEAIAYCALGIAGESGEVAEKLKKIIRSGGFQALSALGEDDRVAVAKECSDVVWYIARLADELRIPLSGIVAKNVEKLSSRKARGVLHGSGDER